MNIYINQQATETQAQNLGQVAQQLQLPAQGVAVAINNRMVPRSEWAQTPVHENDQLVVIKAVCGG